jgi:hypothetical protein
VALAASEKAKQLAAAAESANLTGGAREAEAVGLRRRKDGE